MPRMTKREPISLGPETGDFYVTAEGICCDNDWCDHQTITIYQRSTDEPLLCLMPTYQLVPTLRKFAVLLAERLNNDAELLESLIDCAEDLEDESDDA